MRIDRADTIVVSALRALANFGKLLRRVEDEDRSLVIEKRGTPRAVLLASAIRSGLPPPNRTCSESSGRNHGKRGRIPYQNQVMAAPTPRPAIHSQR